MSSLLLDFYSGKTTKVLFVCFFISYFAVFFVFAIGPIKDSKMGLPLLLLFTIIIYILSSLLRMLKILQKVKHLRCIDVCYTFSGDDIIIDAKADANCLGRSMSIRTSLDSARIVRLVDRKPFFAIMHTDMSIFLWKKYLTEEEIEKLRCVCQRPDKTFK